LRAGSRHGLSDEEKKNASDNFELHLELEVGETLQSVLIGFLCQNKFMMVLFNPGRLSSKIDRKVFF